jgi:hypothetical protein
MPSKKLSPLDRKLKRLSPLDRKLKRLNDLISKKKSSGKRRDGQNHDDTHQQKYNSAPADGYYYDTEKSTKEFSVDEPTTSPIKMVSLTGVMTDYSMPLKDMTVKLFPVPKFSEKVADCLGVFALNNRGNLGEANYIKGQIAEFLKTNGGIKVDKILPFSFETIYDWEDAFRMERGDSTCMLQRVIMALLLSLDDYKNTGSLKTAFGVSVAVAIVGCLAGICKYINDASCQKYYYSDREFKQDLPLLCF